MPIVGWFSFTLATTCTQIGVIFHSIKFYTFIHLIKTELMNTSLFHWIEMLLIDLCDSFLLQSIVR